MLKTLEAIIEDDGRLRLMENVELSRSQRVLVTFLEEDVNGGVATTALLSEAGLAKDWNRREEDEAWQHLQ